MTEYYIATILVFLFLGIIPAKIAESKGKDFGTWYMYGVFLFAFAMIHAITLPELDNSNKNLIKTVKNTSIGISNSEDLNETMYLDIDCPVEVRGFKIEINEKLGLTYCSINFLNISNKIVSSIKFIIKCYDSFGQPVGNENEVETIIQDESANPKTYFGINKKVLLSNQPSTRNVDIIITNILFNDGTTWEKGNYEPIKVEFNKVVDKQELHNLRSIAGSDAICYYSENNEGWICTCGRLNKKDSSQCKRCDRTREFNLSVLDSRESIDRKIKLLEDEHILQEQQRKKHRRKKIKKVALTAVLWILVVFSVKKLGDITDYRYTYKGYKNKVAKQNLVKSINSNDLNTVKLALANGVDVNEEVNGKSFLSCSLYKDVDIEISKYLIEKGAKITDYDKYGNTPIIYCADYGTVEKLNLLIKKGADVNVKSRKLNVTPLDYAINFTNNPDYNIVKLLIDSGADVNASNKDGYTILDTAVSTNIEHEKDDVIKLLKENGAHGKIPD